MRIPFAVPCRRHPLALACAGLALVGSFGAAAQDSAPTPTGLDTITVTAEHRERNLQDVPVSVGVVQGERMRDFTAGGDDKLICVPVADPRLEHLRDIYHMAEFDRLEVQHFFEVYKDLEPGKSVEGATWTGREDAETEVAASFERAKGTPYEHHHVNLA